MQSHSYSTLLYTHIMYFAPLGQQLGFVLGQCWILLKAAEPAWPGAVSTSAFYVENEDRVWLARPTRKQGKQDLVQKAFNPSPDTTISDATKAGCAVAANPGTSADLRTNPPSELSGAISAQLMI